MLFDASAKYWRFRLTKVTNPAPAHRFSIAPMMEGTERQIITRCAQIAHVCSLFILLSFLSGSRTRSTIRRRQSLPFDILR
jgi:hypothetical protein